MGGGKKMPCNDVRTGKVFQNIERSDLFLLDYFDWLKVNLIDRQTNMEGI